MKLIHLLSATTLLLAACKESQPTTNTSSKAASSEDQSLITLVLGASPKGDPQSIKDVKAAAKPGDQVTLTGRIMGDTKPFVKGRAAFLLADPSLISACNDNPGDGCKTPWDSCCNTPEEKAKAIATIQIVNPEGRVLKHGLEGTGGLTKLAKVSVSGEVAAGSGGDVLIINATAIQSGR